MDYDNISEADAAAEAAFEMRNDNIDRLEYGQEAYDEMVREDLAGKS